MIEIEVCYASENEQCHIPLTLPMGSTVIHAIMSSGLLDRFPHLILANNVGIFSKRVTLDHTLEEGDRIEIYRPLTLSPNEQRLKRLRTSNC